VGSRVLHIGGGSTRVGPNLLHEVIFLVNLKELDAGSRVKFSIGTLKGWLNLEPSNHTVVSADNHVLLSKQGGVRNAVKLKSGLEVRLISSNLEHSVQVGADVNTVVEVPLEAVKDNSRILLGRGNVSSAKAVLLKTV
jgi:hypothetical protein